MYTNSKRWSVRPEYFCILFCCIAWAIGILAIGWNNAVLNGWMLIALYITSIVVLFRVNGNRPYPFVVFMIYCFLCNAGQTLTHLLGLHNEMNVDIYAQYSSKLIGEMLFLQGAFVLFMTVGYLLFRKKRDMASVAGDLAIKADMSVDWEDVLLWVVALIVFATYIQELGQRATQSYGEYYYESRVGLGTVMNYVYHVVIFGYLLRNTGWKRKMAYGILAGLALMAIFIGSRSTTIPMVVGCAFVLLLQYRGKIKIKLRYVLLVLLLLYMISIFAEIRDYALSEITISLVLEEVTLSPLQVLINLVQEMGSSARTTLTTMRALDIGAIQQEGTIAFWLLKGIFPLQILEFIGINAPKIESLSAWVSEYGSGPYAEGRGWGYSIIAEIIYNYGGWGVVFSLLFGAANAALENLIEKLLSTRHPYLASAFLYVLGYNVFLARAEMTLLSTRIRYTVYFLILVLGYKVVKNKGRIRIR